MARFSAASRQKLSSPEAVSQEGSPEEDRQFHLPSPTGVLCGPQRLGHATLDERLEP
jgi:hypothetical protein